MSKSDKDKLRGFYRARVAAIQAMFEGYATVQREALTADDCQLPPKKRAAMLKKLAKDEAMMEKEFRRAMKAMEK